MINHTSTRFNQLLIASIFFNLISLTLLSAPQLKPETLNLKPQDELAAYEDTLSALGDSVLHGSTDAVREVANETFKAVLGRALNQSNSFNYPFDLVKTLGKEMAPDRAFRIFNWVIPKRNGTVYSYNGCIQVFDKKKNEVSVFALTDSSKIVDDPQSLKLTNGGWYGALYYKILKNKKNGKQYYTLLGWHGKDQTTTQKIIDVLYFVSGKPVFGYPLFKTEKSYKDRIVFEYNAQAVMSLKYDEGKGMIIFDHLSPSSKEMQNNFSLYGPDGSYDGFRFKGGHWTYMSDIDARTDWKPKKQPKKPQLHEAPIEEAK